MIDRICISINNACNLKCRYCHFREKHDIIEPAPMDVYMILRNAKSYIDRHKIGCFKIGFVGNGEPLLDYPLLRSCVIDISDYLSDGRIKAYTITNGTVVTEDMVRFLVQHNVTIGFSIDGPRVLHDFLRDGSFSRTMAGIELYRKIVGQYPPINATIGHESLAIADEVVEFMRRFKSRITFSRMIGSCQISLDAYHDFMAKARGALDVRVGGLDCTMYGGSCGAGLNNFYFANGKVWLCGNCMDMPPLCDAEVPFDEIPVSRFKFNRSQCFKEIYKGETAT